MIRAVFFDLDGTLFDRASAHHRYCADLIGRRPDAFDAGPSAALDALLDGCDDPGWDRSAFARRAAAAFPRLGTVVEIRRDHERRFAAFIRPEPGLAGLIDGLHGRDLAIVTNGPGRGQRAKLAGLGLGPRTPRAFVSGELGVGKPDPTPFLAALAWAGRRPEETLFVGDDPARDVAGAAGVGMTTCWVARGRGYPPGFPAPDLTIDRVADLLGVLS